jgi:hypothetical protein
MRDPNDRAHTLGLSVEFRVRKQATNEHRHFLAMDVQMNQTLLGMT